MKKKCEKCGKEFEAKQQHFKICQNCFSSLKKQQRLNTDLLLNSYYDGESNLLKDVFIGTPENLAIIFAQDGLASKQLREFYNIILKARNKAILKGMSNVKPLIWECQRNADYQLKRGVIPISFLKFLQHHLKLAEVNEKMLDGFFQHLQSVIAYFPKEKGGQK